MASLDKLSLTLPESQFDIRSLSDKMKVRRKDRALSEIDHAATEHLITTKDGHLIRGQSVYSNTDRVNVSIRRLPTGSLSMLISTNPNKWHHPWETSTDPDAYRVFRDGLEAEIDSLGISCNLPAAQISRLDLARQRKLTHPLMSYHQVFDCVHARRQHQSRHSDSIRIGNKQRQAIIYDKQKEAKIDSQLDCANLIRFETRFLTHETTSKYTGLRSLRDLDSDIESHGFANLDYTYSAYLETEIFAKIYHEAQSTQGDREHIEQLAAESEYRLHDRYFAEIGIFECVRRAGGSDELASLLASVRSFKSEESRNRYYRRVRSAVESRISQALSRRAPSSSEIGSLVDELMLFTDGNIAV